MYGPRLDRCVRRIEVAGDGEKGLWLVRKSHMNEAPWSSKEELFEGYVSTGLDLIRRECFMIN